RRCLGGVCRGDRTEFEAAAHRAGRVQRGGPGGGGMNGLNGLLPGMETSTGAAILFYLFALMAGGSALGVMISRNIVRTAVFLLFTLTGVAGIYFLLGAEFLAAVQLVVYAGGTLILIVFGVMLTSKSPFSKFDPKLGEVMIAVSLGAVLLVALVIAIMTLPFKTDVAAQQPYPMIQLGQALLGDFLVPFEVV